MRKALCPTIGASAFFRGYLGAVAKAHKEGVPIRAYHAWSLMDNYEWSEGYSQRFGFVFVDFRTLKRTVKQSGKWYAQVGGDRQIELGLLLRLGQTAPSAYGGGRVFVGFYSLA